MRLERPSVHLTRMPLSSSTETCANCARRVLAVRAERGAERRWAVPATGAADAPVRGAAGVRARARARRLAEEPARPPARHAGSPSPPPLAASVTSRVYGVQLLLTYSYNLFTSRGCLQCTADSIRIRLYKVTCNKPQPTPRPCAAHSLSTVSLCTTN